MRLPEIGIHLPVGMVSPRLLITKLAGSSVLEDGTGLGLACQQKQKQCGYSGDNSHLGPTQYLEIFRISMEAKDKKSNFEKFRKTG